jgi:hypothetical protein
MDFFLPRLVQTRIFRLININEIKLLHKEKNYSKPILTKELNKKICKKI